MGCLVRWDISFAKIADSLVWCRINLWQPVNKNFCLYRKRLVRKHTRPAFETTRSFISFGKRNKWPCNLNQTLLTFYARLGKQGLYILCYILFLTRFGYIWSKHIYFGYILCLLCFYLKFQCFVFKHCIY